MDLLHNRIVQGALAGLGAAALVDFNAFRSWKSWQDASTYDWKVASFRWLQGAVVGAVAALGFEVVV